MIGRDHISKWLNSGTYSDGVELLRSAIDKGFSCPQFKLIESGQSSVTEKKLRAAIELLLSETPTEEEPVKVSYGQTDVSKLPQDLQDLHQEIKSNYRRKDQLRGQLREIYYKVDGSKKKRPNERVAEAISKEIMSLHYFIYEAWQRIDYYSLNKDYLPGTSPDKITIENLIFLLKEQPKAIAYLAQPKNANSKSALATHYRSVAEQIKQITNGG